MKSVVCGKPTFEVGKLTHSAIARLITQRFYGVVYHRFKPFNIHLIQHYFGLGLFSVRSIHFDDRATISSSVMYA